jgi:xanthine dehydrogenase accessory factor
MYDVALAVAACLRSNTRADVAWLIKSDGMVVDDWNRAVAFTPGGGRIGGIDNGAIDARLAEQVGLRSIPRIVRIEITEVDALVGDLPGTGTLHAVVTPADALPESVWPLAVDREPFSVVGLRSGNELEELRVYGPGDIDEADDEVRDLWKADRAGSLADDRILATVFRAAPVLVVVGESPVADALAKIGAVLGWQTRVATTAAEASGLITPLASADKVVVAAHGLELAGTALLAALESRVGYIGSMGSLRMQEARADWLAYRGATDLSRVRGPAGVDIGASTPQEIAVAIAAEAISASRPVESADHPG